jgi:hypothetical protein
MTVATCACRGHMAQPGTEHTPQGCSVIPFAVLTAITDAMAADRPLNAAELELVDAWLAERGQTRDDWAGLLKGDTE